MDEKRICTECGTENEQGFEYCKNCGALLHGEEPLKSEIASEQNDAPVFENTLPEGNTFGEAFDNIDGIKSEEIALFIGKLPMVYFWCFIGKNITECLTDISTLAKIVFMIVMAYLVSKVANKFIKE